MFRSLKLYEEVRRAVSLFAPNRCPFCGGVIGPDAYYCGYCYERLPFASEEQTPPENVSRFYACCCYRGRARGAVLMLKYGRLIYPADAFALMMSRMLLDTIGDDMPDLIVPVPSGFLSVKRRGFSPALVISKRLSLYLGIPVKQAVSALDDKIEQKTLSAGNRRRNAEKSFFPAKNADVSGKRIILVDDVSTTGSTLSAVAGILLSAGAAEVWAAVFAKTMRCTRGAGGTLRLKEPKRIALPQNYSDKRC